MKLGRLIGYDQETDSYTNPVTGQKENLPDMSYKVGESLDSKYEELTGVVDFHAYASLFIGTIPLFRDLLSFRLEIYTRIELISGTDYANWNALSAEEKDIALIYCSTRIINSRGISFYATECGGQEIANVNICKFLNMSEAVRGQRYNALTNFAYAYLGKQQGLSAEDIARHDFLDTKYMIRGVIFITEDGVEGLGDWVLGLNGYATTGLKPLIIAGTYVLPVGVDVNVFCDALVAIINDGAY
jgi:hypothetical protein